MTLAWILQKLLHGLARLTCSFLADFDIYDPKWPWRSRSNCTIYNLMQDLIIMHLMAKLRDPRFNISKVIVRTSPFLADFDLYDPKWPWRSRSNCTIYNLIQYILIMHLTANFGDPSSIPSKVIAQTSTFDKLVFGWFWPLWPQMTLKVKIKLHHTQSHPISSHNAPNCQIRWP